MWKKKSKQKKDKKKKKTGDSVSGDLRFTREQKKWKTKKEESRKTKKEGKNWRFAQQIRRLQRGEIR